MNKLRKQSDTTYPLFFFMVDSTDHITGKTGLTPTVTISKNGASYASPSGAVSEVGNGLYKVAGNTTDSNTLGELWVHATAAGADPTDASYTIVAFNPFASAIDSNMIQIDGAATSGNNAVLKLKSLDIRPDSASINALHLQGYSEPTSGNGGNAVYAVGGTARGVGNNGGSGIRIEGGAGLTGSNRGVSLWSIASGAGGGSGVTLDGSWGVPPINITVDGYTSKPSLAVNLSGSVGSVSGSVGSVTGSVGSVTTLRPVKNVGYNNFMFPMFDSSTKSPKAGLSVTAQRAIDGNPFASCTNTVAELGDGVYRINLSAADMNGDKIMFRFTATGADDQLIEVFTQG